MHMKQPFSTDLSQCATEAKKERKNTHEEAKIRDCLLVCV